MAYRYCGNCGNEVSEGNRFCPACGRSLLEGAQVATPEADVEVPPPPRNPASSGGGWKKPVAFVSVGCLGLIVFFVFLGFLGALLGGGTQTAQSDLDNAGQGETPGAAQEPPGDEPPAEAEGPEEAEARTYGLGESVRVGDVSYTVTDAEMVGQLDDPLGLGAPLTGDFVVVSFTFANEGSEPATVSDIGMYLYDSEGRQYETDSEAAFYLPDDKSLFLIDRVNPGLSQEVQTVYSVPPDAGGFELEVTSGLFAVESALIELGL